jgi:hypothetical protein
MRSELPSDISSRNYYPPFPPEVPEESAGLFGMYGDHYFRIYGFNEAKKLRPGYMS